MVSPTDEQVERTLEHLTREDMYRLHTQATDVCESTTRHKLVSSLY